jgi:D-lactate dehydrogenase (cytochrome)
MGTDTAVPDDKLKPFLDSVRNLLNSSGLEYAIWGHIGNSHIHANIFPENGGDKARGKDVFENIMQIACSMGGTISGEHGIGKIKKQYMNYMYKPDEIEAMRIIKKQLDPNNILSRGNLFDL